MTYVYEATVTKEPDGYILTFRDFPDIATDGDTIEEVCTHAVELLQLLIAGYLDDGVMVPHPTFSDHPDVIISAEVTDETIAETKCMSITEAAEYLGITQGRVSQLLDSGGLEQYNIGGRRMVTIASVNARKNGKASAGRPRKAVVA